MADDKDKGGAGADGWQVLLAGLVLVALAIYLYIQKDKTSTTPPLLPVSSIGVNSSPTPTNNMYRF